MRFHKYCPRCGNYGVRSGAVCDECDLDLGQFDRMYEADSDELLVVCGTGIGPETGTGDTFHVLHENGEESLCGLLRRDSSAGYGHQIHWTQRILDLGATASWLSTPCGNCDQMGGFDGYKEYVE